MCCQKSTPDFPFWQRGFYSIASNPAKETLSSIRDYHLPFPKEWEQMKAKANEFWFQNVSGIFRSPYPQPFLRIAAPFSREGNDTHSSTLAWKIPWMEEPGGLQSMGSLSVQHDWATSLSLSCIGEGNGNPLQCSCLENPRDGRAWWAAIYGVAQSRTRLKWLSSSSSPLLPGLLNCTCHNMEINDCLQSCVHTSQYLAAARKFQYISGVFLQVSALRLGRQHTNVSDRVNSCFPVANPVDSVCPDGVCEFHSWRE